MRIRWSFLILLTFLLAGKPERDRAAEGAAVANTYWQSGGSGDFSLGDNWSNLKPTGGNVGIFDGRSQVSPTFGLDQLAAVFAIVTTPAYTCSIGGPGNPLKVNTTGLLETFTFRGSGSVYLHLSPSPPAGSGPIVDSPNMIDALVEESGVGIVFCKSGGVLIGAGTDFSRVSTHGPLCFVTVLANSGAQSLNHRYWIDGGEVISDRAINGTVPQIIVASGALRLTRIASSSTIVFMGGGTFSYAPKPFSVVGIAPILLGGAVLDLSENEANPTIGSTIGPRATVLEPQGEGGYPVTDTDLRLDYP